MQSLPAPALYGLLSLCLFFCGATSAADRPSFSAMDVFDLEWVEEPRISSDGARIVYRRMGFDVMRDSRQGNLWLVASDGSGQRKLTSFAGDESQPRWSPDGSRIAYVRQANELDGSEIYVYWLNSGETARITRLPATPAELRWSPDGSQLAFAMHVKHSAPVVAGKLESPEGANWAEPARVTDRLYHEKDGSGYLEPGYSHIFVVPADGGRARQVSSGDFHHRQPAWSADGSTLYVSGNRTPDWEYDYRNSELYAIDLASGDTRTLTQTPGPDTDPAPSPDGRHLAWLGFADREQAYQLTRLRLAGSDGDNTRELLPDLDRSIAAIHWAADSSGLYLQYDDQGRTKIAFVDLDGRLHRVADNLGGATIGRPYGGGSFSVSSDGAVAYNMTRPEHPGELALVPGTHRKHGAAHTLTDINGDLLPYRELGSTEELRWTSSFDGREIQGWLVKPPGFDPSNRLLKMMAICPSHQPFVKFSLVFLVVPGYFVRFFRLFPPFGRSILLRQAD